MLTYELTESAGEPLYQQLYRFIRRDIQNGSLQADEKLPSKRTLAGHLGVSAITVETAYEQLIAEGYVYSRPKKGYFVAELTGIPSADRAGFGAADAKTGNEAAEEGQDRPLFFDFASNRTRPENFPFAIWKRLLRDTISDSSGALMEVSPPGGVRELREAIASHLLAFRGMQVSADQIIVGAGTEYLYSILIQLLGRDRVYCTETPGYQKIPRIYRANDVVCCFAEMDELGVTREALARSGADVAHISPTHHFPTGITMPVNRRYEILAWANERDGRYIIEDDYDSEFRLNGRPIPALQSIDLSEKVIYINTFSKSLSPTIRISYLVLPPHLMERFRRKLSFYSCTVSNFEQYTLARFIREGYFERHINRMRLYYARQRTAVLDAIAASPLAKSCSVIEMDSGLHFLLQIRTERSDEELKRRMADQGIRMAAVSEYAAYPSPVYRGKFVVNYSCLEMKKLPEALARIADCL